jgi:hypothetical protein
MTNEFNCIPGYRDFLLVPGRCLLPGAIEVAIYRYWKGQSRCGCEVDLPSEQTNISSNDWTSSCRRRGDKWLVAMNKWQDITDTEVCKGMLHIELMAYDSR